MNYENVKLWFAKDETGNIITIDDISENNKVNTYSCPMCGSNLIPKATKSIKITSHFAHVDASKCNSESMIHWWFKNKFLEKGDTFTVVSDKERKYICKEVLVEQSYTSADKEYRPDVTVKTECGSTIYFEMDYSNKKKVQDYIDIWLELKNIVVEVDIKKLMGKDKIPMFRALFYKGKCFNIKKNDTYYNTIGKYKEEKSRGNINKELRDKILKLDWFWTDVLRYKKNEINIEHMANLINSIDGEEREIVESILYKPRCIGLLSDYEEYETIKFKKAFQKMEEKFKRKYDDKIKIVNKFETVYDMYNSFEIMSKLNNVGEWKSIGRSSGWINREIELSKIIHYIEKQIEEELEDIRKIEEKKLKFINIFKDFFNKEIFLINAGNKVISEAIRFKYLKGFEVTDRYMKDEFIKELKFLKRKNLEKYIFMIPKYDSYYQGLGFSNYVKVGEFNSRIISHFESYGFTNVKYIKTTEEETNIG